MRWSASRCPSLYRHRKRGKKRLDFTPFRSKMRFRVKSAGFLHGILRLDGIPWSATRHDRTDASVHICVTGPPCRRTLLPRQMATEHSLCHIGVASYGRFCRLLFAKYLSELFLYRYFVYICRLWCRRFGIVISSKLPFNDYWTETKNTKLTL